MNEYVYVGTVPGTLASGRPLSCGDRVRMSSADAAEYDNRRMIGEGLLLVVAGEQKTKRSKTKKAIEEDAT